MFFVCFGVGIGLAALVAFNSVKIDEWNFHQVISAQSNASGVRPDEWDGSKNFSSEDDALNLFLKIYG